MTADGIEVGTVASPLGDWTFARYAPEPASALAASLASAWYFDGVLAYERERVFPKGTHGLVIQLDEPHRAPTGERYPHVVYNGMYTRAIVVRAPPGRVRVVGIDFTASGGAAFAGSGVRETIDGEIDLRALYGSEADALLAGCRRAASPAAILRYAVAFCARKILAAEPCDDSVRAAIAGIERSGGRRRMRELATHVGRSERALERAFRERVGIAPKRYARLARFTHAHGLLLLPAADLAAVADRAGYYDQAHFTSDFVAHAGLSPARYLARERYPDSRSIVEPG